MSDFLLAIPVILKNEGGLVNNPRDPGGVTNRGISFNWYKTINPNATPDDIKNMTVEQASGLYQTYWWQRYKYGDIQDQTLATKTLDMSVNMGGHEAHTLIQRALNACGVSVDIDGVIGPNTIGAMNSNPDGLLDAIISQQKTFYTDLGQRKPELSEFLEGWLKRANWPN